MTDLVWLLVILMMFLLVQACDRGPRIPGVSWFMVQHEMQGTSKKSRGRMQRRKKHR